MYSAELFVKPVSESAHWDWSNNYIPEYVY